MNTANIPESNIESLIQIAMQKHKSNQLDEAESIYKQILQKQPNSTKIWFALGNLYQVQGLLPEAEQAYRQAVSLQPDAVSIYNNLGYTLQQQSKYDEAISCYQKALELQPNCTEASVNLGNTLRAQGQLSPEKRLYYAALNHQLGLGLKKAGDLKNAEACYNRAIELNPNCGEAYISLGEIYQMQQNLKEAVAAYRQGLKLINPCYAKTVESDRGSEIAQELLTTPTILQTFVQVGNNQFPAIESRQEEQGERPFWSVVIPVYATHNRRQYLLQCLVSVLMQWRGQEEMEILLIDDASVPPLYDLVNTIGGGVIRYYRNPQNMGAYRNFNIGVALSRGQWIHLLHDDDYVLPGFYDRLKQSLEGCPESIGAAFTGYENINETGKVVFTQQVYGKYRGIAVDFLQHIGVGNPLNMPAVVISRKVHEHLGGYLPELNYTGDWEFYKRITAFYDWWCEPEILARYRQHTHNITTESVLSGSKGTCLRRAIEISEDYIPQEITEKARKHHFDYCLKETAIPLQLGKVDGALRMVKEALKIDRSTEAVAKFFNWLEQDEAALLRSEIASKFISWTHS